MIDGSVYSVGIFVKNTGRQGFMKGCPPNPIHVFQWN